MKAVHVLPGGPNYPDQAKAKQIGARAVFWHANDAAAPAGLALVVSDMRRAGWFVGTLRDPTWLDHFPDATLFASLLSGDIARLAGPGVQHATIVDYEGKSAEWILDCLQHFRSLRPGRYVYWTLPPFQGGWLSRALVDWINNDPMTWVLVQLYYGEEVAPAERPVSERAAIRDLLATGLHDAKIGCYYDRFEAGWDGALWDWTNIAATLP